jgi:opacity protein-like surface antigen
MRAGHALVASGLLILVSSAAEARADPADSGLASGGGWISTRLSVGARFTYYWLEETRRSGENGYDNSDLSGNFLGSLWGLDAQQHYFPNPYLEYRVASGFGIGVMYDQLRVRTLDWANQEQTVTAGDGDLEIRGVGVYWVARYRNASRYSPYATAGYAWYQSHFFVTPGWAAAGRQFLVEDTEGWFVSGGCTVNVAKHLGVDASVRYSHLADVAARAQLVGNRYRTGSFPMRYSAITLGVSYAF